MKFQWSLLMALLFAVIVAIFAVMNVDTVPVNYAFGTAEWPLILVILGSALLGALISGSVAIFRSFVLQRKVNQLEKELAEKEGLLATKQNEIAAYEKSSSIQEDAILTDENTTI
ncbi:LapA family protein [Paenisporosarcina cavernae]|uniref:DUF1049 domain-containing protein n=1 Tax=Paenisporosarcina cavernae TaxID=2320858 RepID=A0A385YW15_9BACL|nr:lipopolysaccharide assembly protein LapA domain-containing protein [Paenisporosarcina cavernae]AYC29723.1 DUF1049 domain-containing protein [Paenisporosarcina cavernae]